MRSILVSLFVWLALPSAVRAEGPRASVGGGFGLGPAFGAVGLGADWFFTPRLAAGLLALQTIPRAGDRDAIEIGYGFLDAVGRWRPMDARLGPELLLGAGVARVRYGAPGAHTEWAPDVVWGAALGVNVGRHVELAIEASTHATFGARTGTRNQPHVAATVFGLLRVGR